MRDTEQRRAHRKFHDLLRDERGPASAHSCVDCGKPAKEWSWDKGSGDNFGNSAFGDSFDEYSPRCQSCHRKLDAAGWRHSDETRAKMSAVKQGRPLSDTHREAIRKSLKGRVRSEAEKQAIRDGKRRAREMREGGSDHQSRD